MHEPVKFVVGQIAAHAAETRGYLFANFFLTKGVQLCKPGVCVDLLRFQLNTRCGGIVREGTIWAALAQQREIENNIFLASLIPMW